MRANPMALSSLGTQRGSISNWTAKSKPTSGLPTTC